MPAEKTGMDADDKKLKSTAPLKVVLQSYEQQLLAARRLARFRARARVREGLDAQEPDPVPNRDKSVRAVAAELMNLIVFTGLSPDLLEELRLELNQLLQREFEFIFPPDSNLRIYVRENGERRPLSEVEQRQVALHLQRLTAVKVDKSMMTPAKREGIYC